MEQIIANSPHVAYCDSRQGGRAENQDCCWGGDTKFGLLLVVCDGMGGGPSGKLASSMAVNAIVDHLKEVPMSRDKREALREAVEASNTALRDYIAEHPECAGMGTTVVAMIIDFFSAVIAHVGDSRCYQLRGSARLFKTQDHSKVGEMVRAGSLTDEQARLSEYSNIITRALGTNDRCEVEVDERPYEKGDRFVLCTDGIWGAMPDKELVQLFTKAPSISGTVDSVSIQVDEIGFAAGGRHDNHTLIVLQTKTNSQLTEPMSRKTKLLLQVLSGILAFSLLANVMQYCSSSKPEGAVETGDSHYTVNVDSIIKVEKAKYNQSIDSLKGKNQQLQQQIEDMNQLKLKQSISPQPQPQLDTKDKTTETTKPEKTSTAQIDQELVRNLQEIINILDGLKDAKKSPDKTGKRDKAVRSLQGLRNKVNKYGLGDDLAWCVKELNKPITIENPDGKSRGQYVRIISKLGKMRDKVKQGNK